MLDSMLFLPEHSWNDPERRRKAGIPDDVVYRPKHMIALEQIDRALASGVKFGWMTADEWYAQRPSFLQGLAELHIDPKALPCCIPPDE
jgi:SRSO17 transposase